MKGDVSLMVAFRYRNDTVNGMDQGGDGGGSPVRTTNSRLLASSNKELKIRTFSYYIAVGLGKIA